MFGKRKVGYQKYHADDDTYQDIYDQPDRQRGEKPKVTSKSTIYLGTLVVFVLIFLAYLAVGGIIYPIYVGFLRAISKGQMLMIATDISWWESIKILIHTKITIVALGIDVMISLIVMTYFERNWKLQNIKSDHTQLNTYKGDSRLQQPEELPRKYGIFPDRGAHSSVGVTAAIGHMALDNAGVKKIMVTQFYDADTYDQDTDTWHRKDEMMLTQDGYPLQKEMPMFDTKDGHDMFEASGMNNEKFKILYQPKILEYNPRNERGRDNYKTVAEMINHDWHMPYYERQRPLGMYIVDSGPNNTMVLASSRAGKGQDVIEPTIDMWTRSDDRWNFLANDPKSELYRKFYYPASMRGYDVVAFNLMNESRTNIYNPLGYAIMAARQGDIQKVTQFVTDITAVFFPTEGAEDPMWPNAAANAFKRTAYGMIEFYREEEAHLVRKSRRFHWSASKLARKIDVLWGHVTPYNVYQMMVQLAEKKGTDPRFIYRAPGDKSNAAMDYLTSYFEATKALPKNSLRQATMDAHSTLSAMAGSGRTISSVYGIALTAMSFFADPKISRLTSGRPSQDFDMVGLAFPRRVEIHFDQAYMKANSMRDQSYRWEAYHDRGFTDKYEGEDFVHDGIIPASGWLMYVFKGLLTDNKTMKSYFKLTITDIGSHQIMKVFYFEFKRSFERSLDGRSYVIHPVTQQRIVKNGVLRELKRVRNRRTGKIEMVFAHTVIKQRHQFDLAGENEGQDRTVHLRAITQVDVHYTEKPKAIFLVSPPQMQEYAKIGLIMINQLFNMQVDKSYLLRANQKPFYGLRQMLDEVGNLQSGGKGIAGLQTKESIGLGQDQQITLICQTVQQLRDVYNDSIDKILEANTGNIIYLKSTDHEMLEGLQNMSGQRHVVKNSQFAIQRNVLAKVSANDSKITDTSAIEEEPVISITKMLLTPRNTTMVFGKGYPIWNRNQMVNPMSWFLYKKQLVDPVVGEYRLETVPSTSNTNDFDRIANQPDFFAMLEKRVRQARHAKEIEDKYRLYYGNAGPKHRPMTDDDLSRVDIEEFSAKIMEGIDMEMESEDLARYKADQEQQEVNADYDAGESMLDEQDEEDRIDAAEQYAEEQAHDSAIEHGENNDELERERKSSEAVLAEGNEKRYAGQQLSRRQLMDGTRPTHGFDVPISEAYDMTQSAFMHDGRFRVNENGTLISNQTGDRLIVSYKDGGAYKAEVDKLKGSIKTTVNSEGGDDGKDFSSDLKYQVTDEFYQYFTQLDDWQDIASGKFDHELAHTVQNFYHVEPNDRAS